MSTTSLVVDRVEGDLAMLESADGEPHTISVSLLPPGAREGSWLHVTLEIDPEATETARQRVASLRADLVVEDDGEDFAL